MSIKKCVAIQCDNCKAEIIFYTIFFNNALQMFKKCGGIERGQFHYCSKKCKNNHRGLFHRKSCPKTCTKTPTEHNIK